MAAVWGIYALLLPLPNGQKALRQSGIFFKCNGSLPHAKTKPAILWDSRFL